MDLKKRAKELKTDIPALYFCLKSNKTPIIVKILGGITIVYALSPIDLIPDFIPVLGYLDDIIILPMLIALTLKFIPKEIFKVYKEEANNMAKDGILKKWYYAVPIIFIWIVLLVIILRIV